MSRLRPPFSLAVAAAMTCAAGLVATLLLFLAVSQLEYEKTALGLHPKAV